MEERTPIPFPLPSPSSPIIAAAAAAAAAAAVHNHNCTPQPRPRPLAEGDQREEGGTGERGKGPLISLRSLLTKWSCGAVWFGRERQGRRRGRADGRGTTQARMGGFGRVPFWFCVRCRCFWATLNCRRKKTNGTERRIMNDGPSKQSLSLAKTAKSMLPRSPDAKGEK